MRMVELQWVFAERPKLVTERWEWPAAIYKGPGMRHAAYILCEDAYHDTMARAGSHKPLSVCLLKYNMPNKDPLVPHRMLYRDNQFKRFEHAVQWTNLFLSQNKDWQPLLI